MTVAALDLISRLALSEAARSNIRSHDIDGPITESHLLNATLDVDTVHMLVIANPGEHQLHQDLVRMEAYKNLLYAQDCGRHFGDQSTGDIPNALFALINTRLEEQNEEIRQLKEEVQGLKEAQGLKKELREVKRVAKDQVNKVKEMSGIVYKTHEWVVRDWNMELHDGATVPLEIMEVPGGIPLHLPRLTSSKSIQDLSVKDLQEYLQLYKIPPKNTTWDPRTRQITPEDILADRKALALHLCCSFAQVTTPTEAGP